MLHSAGYQTEFGSNSICVFLAKDDLSRKLKPGSLVHGVQGNGADSDARLSLVRGPVLFELANSNSTRSYLSSKRKYIGVGPTESRL